MLKLLLHFKFHYVQIFFSIFYFVEGFNASVLGFTFTLKKANNNKNYLKETCGAS
jgi:hypothetical protein